MKIAAIWINCPSRQIADGLAETLIAERLIAAANCHPEIESRYVWDGEPRKTVETPLLVKTRRDLFAAVAARVRQLHPYATPSILCMDVADADPAYITWVYGQTAPAPEAS